MRQYLQSFRMPTREQEEDFLFYDRRTLRASKYPFGVFRSRTLPTFELGPITIFCGGNGSGKSTILHVMAEKLHLRRGVAYNRSDSFEDYVGLCSYACCRGMEIPAGSRIITSDDVFDYLLDVRYLNDGIDKKRSELFDSYADLRCADSAELLLRSLNDYDRWKEVADAKRSKHPNPTAFVRGRVMQNIRERSNGESALRYFTEEIREDALYLLDEPENSLSAEFQLELKTFLEASARAYNCQFVLATHSPFLLSMRGAVVYDLDADPPQVRPWTDLRNVQVYRQFFKDHDAEF